MLVLGPSDAGKSTLCRFLLGAGTREDPDVPLLDLDVGQKIVGPPACATLGRPSPNGGFSCTALAFVGTTDPVLGWHGLVAGAHRLAAESAARRLLINTDGLLVGPGRRLKAALIEAVRPSLLIALGTSPDLDALIADHPALPVIRLASSDTARRKSPVERRQARQASFQGYFAGATLWSLPLHPSTVEDAPEDGAPPPGLLVGLAQGGRDHALARVVAAEPGLHHVTLLTPAPFGPLWTVRWSKLVLDDTFRAVRSPREPSLHSG